MCGIAGKLVFRDEEPDKALIRAMCNTMLHRGPDDEGIHTAPHIGLGQRRLSIIDLAPSACAPLSNEAGTAWIVFNGEIYNFVELRAGLEKNGHVFRTRSDTEAIVHLYEELGADCVLKLRGMFAFAIWDSAKSELFCARDRLGKKPFCYCKTAESFIFGSEIKAITADPAVSVSPDFHAIDRYLSYQSVPAPLTAFEGIRRLGPGEWLKCDLRGKVETRAYWSPPVAVPVEASGADIEKEILKRLRESVKMRMIADVPLGAFLSGGIDSGIVVALMAQESGRPVKTFTIGFGGGADDELPLARLQARKWGTDHHEFVVEPDAAGLLPLLVRHYNEPFADSSALPTYCVSQAARRHVTVALSGDGGDESFAGYDIYTRMMEWRRADSVPLPLRRAAAAVGRRATGLFRGSNAAAKLRRGFGMLASDGVEGRFAQYRCIVKPEEKSLLYTPALRGMLENKPAPPEPQAAFERKQGEDDLSWMMRHDQSFYLPDCLMAKTDVASMASSLEVRCPFLDHEFVEFATGIPSSMKHDGKSGKVILKSAARDLLHPDILTSPKTGFGAPVARWFRNELSGLLKGNLLGDAFVKRGLFDPLHMSRMVDEHVRNVRDWSSRLWAFLFLEMWFREFID